MYLYRNLQTLRFSGVQLTKGQLLNKFDDGPSAFLVNRDS